MPTVIRGDRRRATRLAAKSTSALVVGVGTAASRDEPFACVRVSVRNQALGRRVAGAVTRALRAEIAKPPAEVAVVRVASRKALERLGSEVSGAIAVVPVTPRSARRAGELVEALRARGALGIQLAWRDEGPPRGAAESWVFAILEHARATPARAPVVLARTEELVDALRILVDRRQGIGPASGGGRRDVRTARRGGSQARARRSSTRRAPPG
jgi:hypothetical protein